MDAQDQMGNQALLEMLAQQSATYTVKQGDTLWAISERMLGDGSRWEEIYALNLATIGTSPNLIYPGQVLFVLGVPPSTEGTTPASTPTPTTGGGGASTTSGAPKTDNSVSPVLAPVVSDSAFGPPCFQTSISPANTTPSATIRPSELAFQKAKAEGQSTVEAFFSTLLAEPGDTIKMFGEVFVEDELKSFVAGMDLANDIMGLSPDPNTQIITTFITQPLANGVDIWVGLWVGDSERIQDAMFQTMTESTVGLVSDKLGIKTSDGRVSPWLVNANLEVSAAAAEATINNIALSEGSDLIYDLWKDPAAAISKKFTKLAGG